MSADPDPRRTPRVVLVYGLLGLSGFLLPPLAGALFPAWREIAAGVHPAPHDPKLITRWMGEIGKLAQYLHRVDHLT